MKRDYSAHMSDSVYSRTRLLAEPVVMILLLVLSVYVVYFTSPTISRIFFLVLLLLFLISKKNYFWFAYFFIVVARPGWLFSDFSGLSTTRLPLYRFLPGMSFTPLDFFLILAFAKGLLRGKRFSFALGKSFTPIIIYGVFLLVVSFVFYGVSAGSLEQTLVSLANYLMFFSFLLLLYKKDEVHRFIYLLFPVIFFILFTQIFYIVTGGEFINLLSPNYRGITLTETGALRSVMGGITLVYFVFVFTLFEILRVRHHLTGLYLWSIAVCCCLSVILSATRIWVVVFSAMLLCFFLFIGKRIKRLARVVVLTAVIVLLLLHIVPTASSFSSAFARISEIGYIAEGRADEAKSFHHRFSVRLPLLLHALKQNWIIGWGFSDTYWEYSDGHVGNFNLLLQVGVVGFILFAAFWVGYFNMIFRTRNALSVHNSYRDSLLVLAIALGALLIAHFSTYSWFAILVTQRRGIMLATFFALSEFFVRTAKHEETCMPSAIRRRGYQND